MEKFICYLDQAEDAGVIEQEESQMIIGVMRTNNRTARGICTPQHNVKIADANETRQHILERFQCLINPCATANLTI